MISDMLLSEQKIKGDPYIGPRHFRREVEDQLRFFGRDNETEEIVSLIVAHKLVLVYAESGAGKTSIFNAQVIPKLERLGLEVLPVARVGVSPGSDSDLNYTSAEKLSNTNSNLYVLNALQSLKPDIPPKSLLNRTLSEFLNDYFQSTHREKAAFKGAVKLSGRQRTEKLRPKQQVLIFDQFEEIFNLYPDRWLKQREEFFRQVNEALDNNRLLRIVFIMREDYIAQLDPFLDILPDRLRHRYRLERLGKEAALQAIKGPLQNMDGTHIKIDELESEIEALVNDLLKMVVEAPDGSTRSLEGEFVEPIQLQVVCRRWWDEKKVSKGLGNKQTSLEDLKVDKALEDFYEDAVSTASKETGVDESKIRIWCKEKLITSSGTRSIVHRGHKTTEGINNNVIDRLERKYLIRKERRAGASWYELTHDRLIKPITNSNEKWKKANDRKRNRKIIITLGLTTATIVAIAAFVYYPTSTPQESNVPSQAPPVFIDQRIVPVGNGSISVAVNPNTGMTYVANNGSNTVSVIQGNNILKDIPVGDGPTSVAVNPNTDIIYVANTASDTMSVISGENNTKIGDIPVGDGSVAGVAVNPVTGTIYLANSISNTVTVINSITNELISNIPVGDGPTSVAVNPNTDIIYVANTASDTMSVISGENNTKIGEDIPVGDGPTSVAVNPNTNMNYVANFISNTITAINGTTNELVRNLIVGNGPISVAIDPVTNTTYVANVLDNTLSIIGLAPTVDDGTLNESMNTSVGVNKGIDLFNLGRYQEAIAIFDRVLAYDPNDVASLYYKGLCLQALGYEDEANEYMNLAQEIDPTYQGQVVAVETVCDNGFDDDNDGLVDSDDLDCQGQVVAVETVCDNGFDDDNDGLVDSDDPDCQGQVLTVTSDPPPPLSL
jgi:YVTN family beta-propeller protein